ncbi:MAG: gamma-glutamyltransferase [Ectothiorhodospiraceae bacterium]|nr:gamma-glutamyltransferase [Ectothiorhodospiraceae bacterium]
MHAHRPVIMATEHALSAGHYLASQVGYAVLEGGGNAVDAGVAAGMALGVVQSDLVNFAGVAPIIVRMAETGQVVSIDGLGTWPKALDPELFMREHGGTMPESILRTVMPAAPDAWLTALERFGTMTFAEVAEGALRLARDGYAADQWMCEYISGHEAGYRRWPQNAAIYLPGGRPPRPGDHFVQRDLGRTIQHMIDQERANGMRGRIAGIRAARDAFYRGDIAAAIADYHRDHGGLVTREDLASFKVRLEPTVVGRFRGLDVHCCGPWSQGPALAQTLALLDGLDLEGMGHNSLDYVHAFAGVLALAFADRERWVADPAFFDVPLPEMLAPDYLEARRALLDPARAFDGFAPPGDPLRGLATLDTPPSWSDGAGDTLTDAHDSRPRGSVEASVGDTSYVCVVDRDGNAFSATPSDVASESPVIPGFGFCPSSRGSQSRPDPRHPSGVAPGKRPRLTPNPALALRDGKPYLVFGTPGGDVQIQAMAQTLANIVCHGMDPQAAIEAPRFATYAYASSFAPFESNPGLLALEGRIPTAVHDGLRARGHDVESWPEWTRKAGAVCAIEVAESPRLLRAGADPRRGAYALGR